MNEREMFEEWVLRRDWCLKRHCQGYADESVDLSWEAWQASAQREGYKLVPLQPSNEVIVAIEKKVENQLEASGINQDPFRLDGETIYKAMMGITE